MAAPWLLLLCALAPIGFARPALAQHDPVMTRPGLHWGAFWAGEMGGPGPRNDFREFQLFVRKTLPWHGVAQNGWYWETALWATGGVLRLYGDDGLILSGGPLLITTNTHGHGYFEIGLRPSLLTDDTLGRINRNNVDLGYRLEFISHVAAGLFVTDNLSVGYRVSHISNGGLSDRNPGINLYTLQLFWHQ